MNGEYMDDLSQTQWKFIQEEIRAILSEADNYRELRQDLRNWLEEFYRVKRK